MKLLIILSIFLTHFTLSAEEAPYGSQISSDGSYLCLSDMILQPMSNAYEQEAHAYYASLSEQDRYNAYFTGERISCETLGYLQQILSATAINIDITSAYLACSGIGTPLAVKLMVAGVGVHMLDFIVGNIPCDNTVSEKQIENKINDRVCKALEANGIPCQLNQVSNGYSGYSI